MYVYCLYIPEYPAWAFERAVSDTKPVVVVSGGRVVSRNHTQKLRGIHTGDRVERVERLCPEAIIRIRDDQVEQACWEDVLREVNTTTPFIENTGPPFVYFTGAGAEDVRTLARQMTVQAGGAWHRSAAQLAAVRSAPGHVLHLEQKRWNSFLKRFDVERLNELAFSEDMVQQLVLFGYRTLGDVCGLSERQMGAQFSDEGLRLYEILHPGKSAPFPLYVPSRSVELWHSLEEAVQGEPGMLFPVLSNLVTRAVTNLGGYRCQRIRVGIQAVGSGSPEWAGRVLSAPQGVAGTLLSLATPLLGALLRPGLEVEGLAILLESLRTPAVQQVGLFDERPAVLRVVRNVHRRYPGSICRAVMRPHALFEEDEMALETFSE
jgi:impB/mucB/samB family